MQKKLVQGARDTMDRAHFCGFMEFSSLDVIACAKRFFFFCILRNPQLSKHELSGSMLLCTRKPPTSVANFTLVCRTLVSVSLLQLQKKAVFVFSSCVFLLKKNCVKENTNNLQRLLNFHGRRSFHGILHALTHATFTHARSPNYRCRGRIQA